MYGSCRCGLEITHIEAMNNLIHSLPPQWRNMGVIVRDEMLEGNHPEHPNTIEFGIYCQTFLDRWSESLELQSEIVIEPNNEVEPELKPEPQFESDPEEDPGWEHEDDFGLDLENDHEQEPEPQVEMDLESGPETEDSSEDEAPPKKTRKIHRD
ncbi:protein TsetseEP-like [Olea europaea var. sylvestris]|uniref:protein TsetseEP-like n=1 Tax=Olea europaea var. sylvestris TaxID=158386 RepID=UPI000C1D54BC|nr:protein TsetseEP-like [Olea europaea var. sylvestris]